MNRKFLIYILLLIYMIPAVAAENSMQARMVLEEKLQDQKIEVPQKGRKQLITINYKDTPIVKIINELAAKRGINILLPQGALSLATKITYQSEQRFTVEQAWDKINLFLEIMGYTWIPQKEYLALKKVDQNITKREGIPLYVDPRIMDIPNTPDVIQTIFYLANIKINDQDNPITAILNDPNTGMLSKDAFVQIDEKSNALIIVDRADSIIAAMRVIKELDLEGIPDAIEVMPLYYTDSAFVETLFKELIIPPDQSTTMVGRKQSGVQASYFPPNTKIMALARTNSIVIMGSMKAIQTVKDFVIKYIDHPLDSGKSILHIYDLQYLDAQTFQPVLLSLINPSQTGQSEGQATQGGPKRDFQDVIIVAEQTSTTAAVASSSNSENAQPGPSQGVQQGGNRLVIAARDHDWQRIKDLITQLDVPQPQVVLEVLVVDLTIQKTRDLGSQIRNKGSFGDSLSDNLNFQSAQLGDMLLKPPINTDGSSLDTNGGSVFPANALMANLLEFVDNSQNNLANSSAPGSLVISLNDPNKSGVWNVWQVLNQYTNASMMAQPFIVAKNNMQATISLAESRFLQGGANSDGGAVQTQNDWVDAPTTIDIIPRISTAANTVNLQVVISVDEYISSSINNNSRITRQVQTNANVRSEEILAIGGLMRERDDIEDRKVPLLGDIPVLGWFFKFKQRVRNKTNLMVFITPRIVTHHKHRHDRMNEFTERKLCEAEREMESNTNLTELRDPITRWFFKPDPNQASRVIKSYTQGDIATYNEFTKTTILASADTHYKEPSDAGKKIEVFAQDVKNPVLATRKPVS